MVKTNNGTIIKKSLAGPNFFFTFVGNKIIMKNKILLWYWNLVYREMSNKQNELGVRWSRLKIYQLKNK
jgi:hypothetical protein